MINTERFWRGMCPHIRDGSVGANTVAAGMRFLCSLQEDGVTDQPDILIRNKSLVMDWPNARVTMDERWAFYLLGGSREQVAFDAAFGPPISLLAALMVFADDAKDPE